MNLNELILAILSGNNLVARQWVQDATRIGFDWSLVTEPAGLDARALTVAAGLVELFCTRACVLPPAWTGHVGSSSEPIWLVRQDMRRFARRVESESPEPLRRRNIFAPANFLILV